MSQDADDVMLYLSLKWSEFEQQKRKIDLEKSLQSWFNKMGSKVECSVESVSTDGSAAIRVNPAPGAVYALAVLIFVLVRSLAAI